MSLVFVCFTCKNHWRIYKYIRLARRKFFMDWWWTYERVHFTCNLHYCTRINRHDWKQRWLCSGKECVDRQQKKRSNRYQVSVNTELYWNMFFVWQTTNNKDTPHNKPNNTNTSKTSKHTSHLNSSTKHPTIQPKNINNTFKPSKQHQCLPTT